MFFYYYSIYYYYYSITTQLALSEVKKCVFIQKYPS